MIEGHIEQALAEKVGPKKVLVVNLVYGAFFLKIFANYHLKSLLTPKESLAAFRDRFEFLIFTDEDTLSSLIADPTFQALKDMVPTRTAVLGNGKLSPKMRYTALVHTFREGIKNALEKNMLLWQLVADSFLAKDCIPKLLSKIDAGHDAVLSSPMRMAFEPAAPFFDHFKHSLSSMELFQLAYKMMHPLWVASHWNAPQFNYQPYSILWNTGEGLFNRSFSVSPAILTPYREMLDVTTVLDAEVPALCRNPFWATNWTDCPIVGIDPLMEFYPPFTQRGSDPVTVGKWAKSCMHPSQFKNLEKEFCYPHKELLSAEETDFRQKIVETILEAAK